VTETRWKMKQPAYAGKKVSVEKLVAELGFTPQAYHKSLRVAKNRDEKDDLAAEVVRAVRCRHHSMGMRKIYHEEQAAFRELGIGRDRLFRLASREGLLVPQRKRYARTTDSNHSFRVYDDLLLDAATGERYRPRRPNEVFVADITYVDTLEGYRYLALITDACSRKIVGYDLSDSLTVEGSLRALRMALQQVPKRRRKGLIHHSDRGVQYCSKAYTTLLRRRGVKISMTQTGSPYDNALAERINGILKLEYGLGGTLAHGHMASVLVRHGIRLYNEERPHLSLGYRKPNEVHSAASPAA
jgi:putative transposase